MPMVAYQAAYYVANREKLLAYAAAYRAANREKRRAYGAAWRKANPEKVKAGQAAYRAANRGKRNATVAAWVKANPDKSRGIKAKWAKANPEKRCALVAGYRALKLQATPAWASQKYITLWYKLAKMEEARTGKKCHVDHIIPLQSEIVCGLHCEDNMQILFAGSNCSKGNRHAP